MVVILKMRYNNNAYTRARIRRKLWSREKLKDRYSYACRLGCYLLARSYLYALYGRKGLFYEYGRGYKNGVIYAYEYPEIRWGSLYGNRK